MERVPKTSTRGCSLHFVGLGGPVVNTPGQQPGSCITGGVGPALIPQPDFSASSFRNRANQNKNLATHEVFSVDNTEDFSVDMINCKGTCAILNI
ncbi:hypothetical protein ILUMI_13379 [Ignelater luminosus]|uniref:Uncharacterized protein n=1 Tax=Ignelater luminosus TaxID=2038154 RepID=A0A8K0CWC8_IGNLU|nr:hypothetical protein ILUMI_13379 [Ignelater luminosus]